VEGRQSDPEPRRPPEAGDKEIKRTTRDQAGVVDGRAPRATLRRSMDVGGRRRVSFFPPRRPSEDTTTDAPRHVERVKQPRGGYVRDMGTRTRPRVCSGVAADHRGRASPKDERRRPAEEGWEKRDGTRRIDAECPSSSARPDGLIKGSILYGRDVSRASW